MTTDERQALKPKDDTMPPRRKAATPWERLTVKVVTEIDVLDLQLYEEMIRTLPNGATIPYRPRNERCAKAYTCIMEALAEYLKEKEQQT